MTTLEEMVLRLMVPGINMIVRMRVPYTVIAGEELEHDRQLARQRSLVFSYLVDHKDKLGAMSLRAAALELAREFNTSVCEVTRGDGSGSVVHNRP